MSVPSQGIIYIATGRKYITEACDSAASVKRYMPEIPITLFSDLTPGSGVFNKVLPIDHPTHGPWDKIAHIGKSPYQQTLYLDSDTSMIEEISEIFILLERFDLATAHAPYRAQYHVPEVPDCFPEYNTGVFLFRKSVRMDQFFRRWGDIYREDGKSPRDWLFPGGAELYSHALPNQPAFRRALYESNLSIATLPPEYNCRVPFPGFAHTKVKILHGRVDSLRTVTERLNTSLLPRVHVMRWGKLKIIESGMPPGDRFLARLRWSLHHRGLVQTAVTSLSQGLNKLRSMFS